MNDKQKTFCREYLIDYNATAAYKRAGYKDTSSAEQNSCRLISKDKVKAEIRRLQTEKTKNMELTVQIVLDDLNYGLEEAKRTGDLRAYAKFCELRGKHKAMYVDRQQTEDSTRQRELDESESEEAKKLAVLRFKVG